jgi:pyruvate dehydrogenase E1 component alpha subunit
MPISEIDLPYKVQFLSILDEYGHLDKDLEPDLSAEMLLKLYRGMVLARKFDERMLILQRGGRIGTFAPIKGQEAQVGAAAVLAPEDWLVPSFRETPAELWRGKPMENVLLLFSGFNEGGAIAPELNNLPVSIPVGSQTLHAVGIAYGLKYQKKNSVVMCCFGDGATSEGDFHEAMNFAAVFQLPVIFICQNNHWAISIPRSHQTHSKTIAQKALAYDMPGLQVDGNDVLALYVAAEQAVERAKSGGGPTFIESVTYRLSLHTTADDPTKYRKDEEVQEWAKRDPIPRFQNYLLAKGVLTDESIKTLDDEIQAEVRAAEQRWAKIAEGRVDSLDMFDYVYAELPPGLREQKEQLRREIEERPREAAAD